jgi:dGTPase
MKQALRRLRFPVAQSRGRRYPEPPHKYRNEFQRDRDRVVHARAFRRLEDKTQVFPAGISDHFRNRLTHTIEVSQISRTVAAVLGLDEDLTEALALAHDIGHSPFAHAGEEELNRQMAKFGESFNHNLHALHIVESFEQRYVRFPGLNLTFEVREGIVKHSGDLTPGSNPELDEYLPELRPPLEAQLIDLADEIAYDTADLDDGFSANLFSLDDIATSVPGYATILDRIETRFPGAPDRARFQETLRSLIDELVSGLIEGTWEAAVEAGVNSVEDVRKHPWRLAMLTRPAKEITVHLKHFLRTKVYESEAIQAERQRSIARLGALFEFYLAHPDRLPHPYRNQTTIQPVHRVVCDYIAGMTDGFFERTWQAIPELRESFPE